MAEIKTRITLEGLKQFEKDLKSGSKAMDETFKTSQDLKKGMSEAEKAFSGTQKESKKTVSSLGDLSGEMNNNANASKSTSGAMSKLSSDISEAASETASSSIKFTEFKSSLQNMQAEAAEAGNKMQKIGAIAASTKSDVSKLGSEFKGAGVDANSLGSDANTTGTKLSALGTKANGAKADIQKLGTEAKSNSGNLDKMKNAASGLGDKLNDLAGKAKDVSSKIGIAVGGMVTNTVGIDTAVSQMNIALGATGDEAKRNKELFGELYKSGVGGTEEVANAIIKTKSVFKDLDDGSIKSLAEQGLSLSKIFGTDVDETMRSASIMAKNFGISGQEAFNVITYGMQNGLNFSGDYLDTLAEYSVQYDNAGYSAQEFMGVLMTGMEKGVFNTDKMADSFKELRVQIMSGSEEIDATLQSLGVVKLQPGEGLAEQQKAYESQAEAVKKLEKQLVSTERKQATFNEKTSELTKVETAEKIAEMKEELKKSKKEMEATAGMIDVISSASNGAEISYSDLRNTIAEGGASGKAALALVVKELESVEDKALQNQYATALFGATWEDVGPSVIAQLSETGVAFDGLNTAAADMAEGVQESIGVKLSNMFNSFRWDLDDALGDKARDIIDRLAPLMENLAEALAPFLLELGRLAERAIPIVIEMIEKLTKWMATLDEDTIRMAFDVGALVLVVLPVVSALAKFIGVIMKVVPFVVKLAKGFAGLFKTGGVLAKMFGGIIAAIKVVVAFIVANPLLVAIAVAIAAIVALVVMNWDSISSWFINAWQKFADWLGNAITAVGEFFKNLAGIIVQGYVDAFTKVWEFITGAWNAYMEWSAKVREGILNMFKGAAESVGGFFSNAFERAKAKITGILEGIREIVEKVIGKIKSLFDFDFSLPKLNLPHFSVEGSLDLNPFDGDGFSMPKPKVDWYETGGIFTGPSIVGIGENGDEAVLPLSNKSRLEPFAAAMANQLHPKMETTQMDGGSGVMITGNTFNVREEADIDKIAEALHRKIRRDKKRK